MTINWKIAGKAGEGIAATSFLMSKTCQQAGLFLFEYSEYPSLIRGGQTSGQVHASSTPVHAQKKEIDILIAMNEASLAAHLDEVTQKTRILLDTKDQKIDFSKYPKLHQSQCIFIPSDDIAREATGKSLASNMVFLAISCYLLGLNQDALHTAIGVFFAKKGEAIITSNRRAAEMGLEHFQKLGIPAMYPSEVVQKQPTYLISGSEAIGFGALAAGVGYYSAYPMTPASTLMTFLADAQKNHPLVVRHAEDEIAAINNALGASFAGVRAMTGTAGGGFALMVEAVSLAGVTELPLVAVIGGRPGPATGLPTWTSQTDLLYVIYSGHGEFPKVVLTPGNLAECFALTKLAFTIAEKYHTQCYIIADKLLLESRATVLQSEIQTTDTIERLSFAADPLPQDNSYRRFLDNQEGYSPRSIPGQPNGLQLTNSYEHDTYGWATEDGQMAKTMVAKRLRKYKGMLDELPGPVRIGPDHARTTFVCWGSTRLVLEDSLPLLNAKDPNTANIIHLQTILPFHTDTFLSMMKDVSTSIIVEENATGQAESFIRSQCGYTFTRSIRRFDGRPLYTEDIVEGLL